MPDLGWTKEQDAQEKAWHERCIEHRRKNGLIQEDFGETDCSNCEAEATCPLNKIVDLDKIAKSGVLPQLIVDNGIPEKTVDVIICSSISGGARYKNDMPEELELVHILEDGTEYRMRYVQKTRPGK